MKISRNSATLAGRVYFGLRSGSGLSLRCTTAKENCGKLVMSACTQLDTPPVMKGYAPSMIKHTSTMLPHRAFPCRRDDLRPPAQHLGLLFGQTMWPLRQRQHNAPLLLGKGHFQQQGIGRIVVGPLFQQMGEHGDRLVRASQQMRNARPLEQDAQARGLRLTGLAENALRL